MAAHQAQGQPQPQQPVKAPPPRRRGMEETAVSEPVRRTRASGPGGPGGPGGGGPRGGERDRPNWRRFVPSWKILLAGAAVVSAGLFGMIAVAYANTPVPSQTEVQEGVNDQGSIIYYANGKDVLAKLGVKRKPVTYDQIPRAVQDAVIAAENSDFRNDAGISFSGMVRSVWSTASGQQIQGASTITQQMARNYYDGLSKEVSIQRKVKEIFVAVKLNKSMPKEQILEQYLNTIYFGRGAYGIGAAAEAFFKKKVQNLTAEEGAYLAGRIQNPDAFDRAEAAKDMGQTEFRYNYVIQQMAKLDPGKYAGLLTKSPKSPKREDNKNRDYFKGLTGYMVTAVLNELAGRGISRDAVDKGGLTITSTFDIDLMKAARSAVHQHTKSLDKEINATLAAVDPRNGRIVAFYGGDDYETDQWNDAFLSQKQAASAFKPYVLAAWLQSGYSLRSYLPTKGPIKLPGTTPIGNDHSMKASAVDVVGATANSVNTAYAKMGEKVGLDMIVDIAAQAGIDRKRLERVRDDQSFLLTIGSSEVTAVEQAGGYSIFANGGKHFDNHVVKSVYKGKDRWIKEDQTPNQVISAEAAADAVVALEAVVKQGTGKNARLYDRPVAGKTGTNNRNKEAWFVGFAPQLSTAVGMFRQECKTDRGTKVQAVSSICPWYRGKDPAKETKYTPEKPYSKAYEIPLGTGFQGATYPAAIWRTFMTAAMKGEKVEQFPARANTGTEEDLAPKPVATPTANPSGFPEDDGTCGLFEQCDPNDLDESDQSDDVTDVTEDGGHVATENEGGSGGPGGQDTVTVPDPMATRRDDG